MQVHRTCAFALEAWERAGRPAVESFFRSASAIIPTYYSSRFVSQIGQGLFLAALFMVAGAGSAPALGLSSILFGMMGGAILVGLPGGALADRLGPPRGLVLGALLRGSAIALGLAVVGHAEYAWVIAFLYSSASQVFSPSEMALIPVVHENRAGRAHVALIGLQHAGQAVGAFALGPALYLAGGPLAMFAGGVVAYAITLGLTTTIARRLRSTAIEWAKPEQAAFHVRRTLRFLMLEPAALYAIALLAFTEMATKSMGVSLEAYVRQELDLSLLELIALLVPGFGGVGLGLLVAGRACRGAHGQKALRMTLAAITLGVLALGGLGDLLDTIASKMPFDAMQYLPTVVDLEFVVAFPVALLLGLGFSIAIIGARKVLTETAPPGHQSRVFAAQAAATDLLIIAPLALSALGTDLAGPRASFLFVGGIGLLLFLLLEETIQEASAFRISSLRSAFT